MKFSTSIYARILGILATLSLILLAGGFCYLLYENYKSNLTQKARGKETMLLASKKRYPFLGNMPNIGVREAKFKTKFIAGGNVLQYSISYR